MLQSKKTLPLTLPINGFRTASDAQYTRCLGVILFGGYRPPALPPSPSLLCRGSPGELPSPHLPQAEKFRSKAQKSEVFRSYQQYCRYLFYVGRIRTIQLEYTDAKESLQQVRGRGSGCCGYEGGGAGAGQAATVSP